MNRFKQAQEYQKQKLQEAGYGNPTLLAPAVTASAVGVGMAAGTADLFMGESNALNSNEFLANGMLTQMPVAGAMIGSAVGALTTPDKETALKDLKKDAKAASMKAQKEGNDPNIGSKTYTEHMKQGNAKYENMAPGVDMTVAQHARARRGAAIGAAAALVPTLMSLRDTQQLSEQSAALM